MSDDKLNMDSSNGTVTQYLNELKDPDNFSKVTMYNPHLFPTKVRSSLVDRLKNQVESYKERNSHSPTVTFNR